MEGILQRPTLLTSNHEFEYFDCGIPALNNYLMKFALLNNNNHSARTYVSTRDNIVVGYYSLAYGTVSHEEATARVKKGLAKHPIPTMLLARLAVDKKEQGKGLGKSILKDALLRTIQAADIAGLRAIIVHAKDEMAEDFYKKFGFEESPIDPFHLLLHIKDIRRILLDAK